MDLRTVVPRPEAVAFAERWDRDPRQVEVVLREAPPSCAWSTAS